VSLKAAVSVVLLVAVYCPGLVAQDSKLNTNLGAGVTVPVNPTARFVDPSANLVVGAGYNISKHHSLIGQFMWAHLPPANEAFRAIRLLTGARDIDGSSNLFALTGNYRLGAQGRVFGVYFIAGGGMYHRRSSLSRRVVVGATTVCSPPWLWWGYTCVAGLVSDDETLIREGSTAFGGNGGVGFTIKINEEGYKFYVESRYHYAPNRHISTQIIPITLGFSW
jgi:hypothetical protein